jgi:[protein-PII] uridylyltransferase
VTAAGRLRELRAEWSAPRAPDDPALLPGRLTGAIDSLILEIVHGRNTSGWAVVALGGYGRVEMCLHSDIDVMLLGTVPPDAVRQVLYPLWDTGMKVGHSVRTVKEAITAAGENLETLCSLLTTRLITGEEEPWNDLQRELAGLLRKQRSVPSLLAAEERALRRREPFFLQEADLKTGRGGLRSIQRDDWMRIRAEMLGASSAGDALGAERSTLLSIRNALHATQGRGVERLAVDIRGAVAGWLGEDPFDTCARLYQATRAVDDHLLARWPEGKVPDHDPVARAGRRLVSAVRLRRQAAAGEMATPLPVAIRHLDHPGQVSGFSDPVDRPWTPSDRAALVELLAGGAEGWAAFRRLGYWGREVLPELALVESLPQTAVFHSHPVDSHLWRTVDEVVFLTSGGNDWCTAQADDLGSIDELLLAAWLHDIGKGRGGDHSEIGSGLAAGILARFGYNQRTVDLVKRGVALHLLLPFVATREDLDDPGVIRSTAAKVDDPELLSLLAVLSVADARATGPAVWSEWSESLLRTLVDRVGEELQGTSYGSEDTTVEPHLAEHVAAMPSGYLRRFGVDMAGRHMGLATPPPSHDEVRVEVSGDSGIPTVVVVAMDRPGLLAVVSGVFALHGLNVLEARIATRSDGVAIDTFRVEDALGELRLEPADWDQIRTDLHQASRGALDLSARLAAKAAAYASAPIESRVTVDIIEGGWRFTVRGPDRVGLLHDLAHELTSADVEILMAKVTTRGQEVIDVFSVTPGGMEPSALAARLQAVIEA